MPFSYETSISRLLPADLDRMGKWQCSMQVYEFKDDKQVDVFVDGTNQRSA